MLRAGNSISLRDRLVAHQQREDLITNANQTGLSYICRTWLLRVLPADGPAPWISGAVIPTPATSFPLRSSRLVLTLVTLGTRLQLKLPPNCRISSGEANTSDRGDGGCVRLINSLDSTHARQTSSKSAASGLSQEVSSTLQRYSTWRLALTLLIMGLLPTTWFLCDSARLDRMHL